MMVSVQLCWILLVAFVVLKIELAVRKAALLMTLATSFVSAVDMPAVIVAELWILSIWPVLFALLIHLV